MDNSACLQTRLQYFGQKLEKQRRNLKVPKFKIKLKKGRWKKDKYEKSRQKWGYLSNLWESFRNFPYRNNPMPRGLNPRSRTDRNHRQQLAKPYKFDHNLMKRDIDSLDDCFDFIEEPSYGFRVNITQEIPCSELGEDCGMNSTKTDNSTSYKAWKQFKVRQTGEEFASDAPPDCRITECN